jgi:hypothetical protein
MKTAAVIGCGKRSDNKVGWAIGHSHGEGWIKADGVIFFCYGTPHCTTGNHTTKDRAGLAYHFLHASANDSAAIGGYSTRPILWGPDATGGLREHKEKVAGIFQHEVDETLNRKAKSIHT